MKITKAGVRSNQFYDEEFRRMVVRAVEEGRTPTEVAKIFDVSHSAVHDWLDKYSSTWKPGVSRRHQRVTEEIKLAIVHQVLQGRAVPDVAKEYDVSPAGAYKWMKQYSGDKEALARKVDVGLAMERLRQVDEEKARAKSGRTLAVEEEQKRVQEMIADPLVWMQRYTETKDSHWREHGADSPFRPFPDYPYLRAQMDGLLEHPLVFIAKSRNMMLSWLCVGYFAHAAMTTPGIEVLFQSQKEDKAFELVEYAKTLYDRQHAELKRAFPLTKQLKDMADGELVFANNSRIIGIPGGADQIRSYHPWGLLMDEAAFMPEAGDCYNNALPVCKRIVVLSSAGPGWFAETMKDTV
jgi:transposase-like protein